jgi:hypothetical protein
VALVAFCTLQKHIMVVDWIYQKQSCLFSMNECDVSVSVFEF